MRRRADLTFWIDDAALAGWQAPRRTTSGGQRLYSDWAIELVLTLRLVFHLALRQAERLSASLLRLLGVQLSAPDHTTLSCRGRSFAGRQPRAISHGGPIHMVLDSTGLQLFGQGKWDAEKHGRTRRPWRKRHVAVDASMGGIAAHVLTDTHADDAAQTPALLRQAESAITSVTAEGTDNDEPAGRAAAARQHGSPPDIVVPLCASAVASKDDVEQQPPRDRHIRVRAEKGRIGWQQQPVMVAAAWSRPRSATTNV